MNAGEQADEIVLPTEREHRVDQVVANARLTLLDLEAVNKEGKHFVRDEIDIAIDNYQGANAPMRPPQRLQCIADFDQLLSRRRNDAGFDAGYERPLTADFRGHTVVKAGPWTQGPSVVP